MFANEQKEKQNFFYKIMEKEDQTPYQRELAEEFRRQRADRTSGVRGDVFTAPPTTRIERGPTGYKPVTPKLNKEEI